MFHGAGALLFLALVLVAPAAAHDQRLRYGPLEGYTFDIVSDHTHTELSVSVSPDMTPADAYYGLCIVTAHQDDRAERDTTCGETLACAWEPSACDDVADPVMEGCANGRLDSPMPIGDDDSVVVEVRVLYVDQTTGGMCASGTSGTVHLAMY